MTMNRGENNGSEKLQKKTLRLVQKFKGIRNSTVPCISNKIHDWIPGSFHGRETEWNEITYKLSFTAKEFRI